MSSPHVHLLKRNWSVPFIDQFDLFNEELRIYRTLIVCNDDRCKEDIFRILDYRGYSVCISGSFEDFLNRNMRIYIMTIGEYYKCSYEMLHTISCEHNMIITCNLEDESIVSKFVNNRSISDDYYIWIN